MKTMKNIWVLQILMLGLLLSGCEKKYDDPAEYTPANLTPTTTIAELKTLYQAGPTLIDQDLIIGGKVISTDRYGNFYRSLYIEDGTSGIEVRIGKTGLYNIYPRGMMMYVKVKGLCLGAYGGMVSLGAASVDAKYENTWIDVQYWIDQTIFRGKREALVTPTVVTSVAEVNSNPNLLGTLIRLENVTFVKGSLNTWALADNKDTPADDSAYGEHKVKFGDNNATFTIRTSGYSKFAMDEVPANNSIVNVTAVITKFNSTLQLVINNATDVEVVTPAN